MIMKLLLYITFNMLGLLVAEYFVAGFAVVGGLKEYLIAGILLGIVNLTVRPILRFITFPIILLTLGLFNIVLSAILLWTVSWLTGFIFIADLFALFEATIILGIINTIGQHTTKFYD